MTLVTSYFVLVAAVDFFFETATKTPSRIDKNAEANTLYSGGRRNTIVWQGIQTNKHVVSHMPQTKALKRKPSGIIQAVLKTLTPSISSMEVQKTTS
jgi:hypothetical protein